MNGRESFVLVVINGLVGEEVTTMMVQNIQQDVATFMLLAVTMT